MVAQMKKFFEDHFETKKFFFVFRAIVLLSLIVVVINFISLTLSRYATDVDAEISPNLAFFITDVGTTSNTIELGEILPSSTPYFYTINVSNFEDDKRVNVNVEYDIKFITTTNLPLNIKVFKNTSNYSGTGIITGDSIAANADGMYLRTMTTTDLGTFTFSSNQTNAYIIRVEFPESYKYYSKEYEGVIDLVEVVVDARQKV